jgi:hypothetical protein
LGSLGKQIILHIFWQSIFGWFGVGLNHMMDGKKWRRFVTALSGFGDPHWLALIFVLSSHLLHFHLADPS